MAAKNEIEIKMKASGVEALNGAMKGVENSGKRTGKALEDAGKSGNRSFAMVRTSASGLNSVLNTTANLSASVFTGVLAGGALLSGGFNVAKGAVDGLKSSIESLKEVSIQAANDIRDFETLAATFQMSDAAGVSETQGIIDALQGMAYSVDGAAVAGMLTKITTKLSEASQGSAEAAQIFTDLGISMTDLVDIDTGEIANPIDAPLTIVDAASKADAALRNNVLERLLGRGDLKKFAPVFEQDVASILSSAKDLSRIGNITERAILEANRVTTSQQRVQVAIRGVGNSLLSGMGPSISKADDQFVDFLVNNQGRVEDFGKVIGDFSGDIYAQLISFADAVASDFAGTGGQLAEGPLATGLDFILESLDFLLDRLREVSAYISKGESTEWIDNLVENIKKVAEGAKSFGGDVLKLAKFIREDVAPAVGGFIGKLGELYKFLGVEDMGAQMGITLALLAFSSTIITITASIAKMITNITGVGGAVKAAVKVMTTALGAMAPAAALIAAPIIGAKLGANEGEALRSYEKLYGAVPKLAEKYGEQAAAAFALAGEQTLANKNESWSAWLTGKLGLTDSKEDRVIDLQARLSDRSKDEIIRDLSNLARNEGVKVLDDLEFDIGAGITITGAEINREIEAQLASIPATIQITAIEGLQEQIASSMGGTSRLASSAAVGGIATTGSLSPTTIEFNGQPVADVYASQDQIAAMRKAQSRMTRGR